MKKTIFYLVGIFLTALGVYGFITNPGLQSINNTSLHNIYHLITGIIILCFAYKKPGSIEFIAKLFGLFYIPLIFESYIGHHNIIEAHTMIHFCVALILIIIGFWSTQVSSTIKE
jgi:hypothetical protein